MTGPRASVTEPGPLRQVSRGIGRAAALIGSITVVARVVGFGRQLVFAHTVGSHCLGTAYTTANQVPNIIYDIVLGGALTSAVVPVLAGAAARRHRRATRPGAPDTLASAATGLGARPDGLGASVDGLASSTDGHVADTAGLAARARSPVRRPGHRAVRRSR